jgi:glutamine amidotransferase
MDYGVGNLHSLAKALELAGASVAIHTSVAAVLSSDVIVLPGVGAFAPAAAQLSKSRDLLRRTIMGGRPTLGICLGMQLLFDESDEGSGKGLGVFRGRVARVRAASVPHMGWNTLDWVHNGNEHDYPAQITHGYFANSFVCRPADEGIVTAWTTHESDRFPAIVRSGNAVGVQFHPEKSSTHGIALLRHLLAEISS